MQRTILEHRPSGMDRLSVGVARTPIALRSTIDEYLQTNSSMEEAAVAY